MHICIVGTGAAGWITAFTLKNLDFVNKITIIGSPSIPTIGVGESTTLTFYRFLKSILKNSEDYFNFLVEIDAAIKYGVSYENWSKQKFLNSFVGSEHIQDYGYLLGVLANQNININDYITPLHEEIYENNVCIDQNLQKYSLHFDANKLIKALENRSKKESKINHIIETVNFSDMTGNKVNHLLLSNNKKISADYYISCIGQTAFNQKIFKEEYDSYNHILLTDKACFYPLPYKNKKEEFHPYTKAKTMPYGWRWITPTWSRIGTGYVFSSNHLSLDNAKQQLISDIGDESITPFDTDFHPRAAKEQFKINHCSLGMASGFLEPLDAPGLGMLLVNLNKLCEYLHKKDTINKEKYIKELNTFSRKMFNFWCCFILHQYKTCHRNDTDFWKDQKNVKWDYYEEYIEKLFNSEVTVKNENVLYKSNELFEPWMLYNTTAGKNISWTVDVKETPMKKKINDAIIEDKLINHFDLFSEINKRVELNASNDV